MKTYIGTTTNGKAEVFIDDNGTTVPLSHLSRHNDGQFIWGTTAEDSLDLSLSLLSNSLGLRHAEPAYRQFAEQVIAKLNPSGWELTQRNLLAWMRDYYLRRSNPLISHQSTLNAPAETLNQLLAEAVNLQHLSLLDNQELSD